jgi:hypothetical protein
MDHFTQFTGAPAYRPLVQMLGPAVTTPTVTLTLQPSGLQSQGQTATQFASPTQQVSQLFASPGLTPIWTGFTPITQSQSVSLIVSRSLSASYSELTGEATPPVPQVFTTTSLLQQLL